MQQILEITCGSNVSIYRAALQIALLSRLKLQLPRASVALASLTKTQQISIVLISITIRLLYVPGVLYKTPTMAIK